MDAENEFVNINRRSWNARVEPHLNSAFYDVSGFLAGKTSLQEIELGILGDIRDKRILHLQCHFGQDTISLARMGARVTGVDLSDTAIEAANNLAERAGAKADFICCNIYDLPQFLDETFDLVFTSYGTIGWLPDLDRWAGIISRYLKPGGKFVFVEFHPVIWMFDDEIKQIGYDYFNTGPIIETNEGTYADREADISLQCVMWNHSLGEVVNSLIESGLSLDSLEEYDYSPYNIFVNPVEIKPGRYRVGHIDHLIPMVYSIVATKTAD